MKKIFVLIMILINISGVCMSENKLYEDNNLKYKKILYSFHVVNYLSNNNGELVSFFNFAGTCFPYYVGKLYIYDDYSIETDCISQDSCSTFDWIKRRIDDAINKGLQEFSYNTPAEKAEDFMLAKRHIKEEKDFSEMLIREIFSHYGYRYIDNKIGEEYLKNGWKYEQKNQELVNATILMPGDKILKDYMLLLKRTLRELPLTEEQKRIRQKESINFE
jgi:hypothetical protein